MSKKIIYSNKRSVVKKHHFATFLLISILFLAFLARFFHLDEAPPGVWYDEAYNGWDAWRANQQGWQIFYPENYGREGLFINLIAFLFKITNRVNTVLLRVPGALIGFLTVPGFYLLLRKFRLSRPTALLATFALAVSFYHLNFSRIAFRAIMVPFLLVWSFYFFFRGWRLLKINRGHQLDWRAYFNFFLAGALTGLGLHTYIAYRVVPLIFLLITPVLLSTGKLARFKYWKSALSFLVGALVTAAPLFLYFYQHPAAFSGRANTVSVFNVSDLSPAQAMLKSLFYHLQSIFFVGDQNQRHNYRGFPLLPAVWALFFLVGFIISWREIILALTKKRRALFWPAFWAQVVFWVMLIPGILSLQGIPHFLRIIGIIPAIFLLLVLPFEYFYRLYRQMQNFAADKLKPHRWQTTKLAAAGLLITFLLTGFSQLYLYFRLWAQDPSTAAAFQRDWTELGKFIKYQPTTPENYLILPAQINLSSTNYADLPEKTLLFTALPTIQNYLIYTEKDADKIIEKINCSQAQIILHPTVQQQTIEILNNYCRNLHWQKIILPNQQTVNLLRENKEPEH